MGIEAGGTTAIDAFSQGGASAYIASGTDAADFYGTVNVHGTMTKSGGSFKIDHPLDPDNKYLSHSFVESPDMKNIYDGVATLDANGSADVKLADWFGALNKDFCYQLTSIGAPGPNLYIAEEIKGNHFKISGGAPGAKVSWQVTGTRQDAWANAHRIPGGRNEAERGARILCGTGVVWQIRGQEPAQGDTPGRHEGAAQTATINVAVIG